MRLNNTVNAYFAARAVFVLLVNRPQESGGEGSTEIRRVAMPGLGTGVGEVGPTCAFQVRAAYEDVVLGRFEAPGSWTAAVARHRRLIADWPAP